MQELVTKRGKKIEKGKVTVLVNCYNSELYLRETLDSLFAQTFTNFEVIFWDNGSTDGSAKIAKTYDHRLRYFYTNDTVPLYHARKRALEHASGEFIAFLDCDDLWHKDNLAKKIPLFSDPRVGLVYSDVEYFTNNLSRKRLYETRRYFEGSCLKHLVSHYFLCLPTVVVRRIAIEELKDDFDKDFLMIGDMDLFCRVARTWNLRMVPLVLASYRVHHGSLSTSHSIVTAEETFHFIEKYFREFPQDYSELHQSFEQLRRQSVSLKFVSLWRANRISEAQNFGRIIEPKIKKIILLLALHTTSYERFHSLVKSIRDLRDLGLKYFRKVQKWQNRNRIPLEPTLNIDQLSITETIEWNQICGESKKIYNQFCEAQSLANQNNLSFLLSPLMSRHPLVAPFFLYFTKLIFLREHQVNYRNIVTSDYFFYRFAKANSINLTLTKPIRAWITYMVQPIRLIFQCIYLGLFNKNISKIFPKQELPRNPIFLDCFFLPKDLQNSQFTNSYFTGIDEKLNFDQNSAFYLVTFAGFRTSLKSIFQNWRQVEFKSKYKIITKEHFLSLKDLLNAFQILNFRRMNLPAKAAQLDLMPILKENLRLRFHPSAFEAVLNWLFIQKISKQTKVSQFYTWYENQNHSKGFTNALHRFSPEAQIYGYQGLIYSSSSILGYQPTSAEFQSQLLPDKILIISPTVRDSLNEFCPEISSEVFPSFRYTHIAEYKSKSMFKENWVAVTLPLFLEPSIYILNLLAKLASYFPGTLFQVKFHPASNQKFLKEKIKDLQNSQIVASGERTEILIQRSMVLLSSASGTCFESVMMGTPVAVIGIPNEIVQDTIPPFVSRNMRRLCWTEDELRKYIKEIIHPTEERITQQQSEAEAYRKHFFSKTLSPLDSINIRGPRQNYEIHTH